MNKMPKEDFSEISESVWSFIITHPKFKYSFREWERSNLAKLIRNFNRYKITFPPSNKAKSIRLLDIEDQELLIDTLANSADIVLPKEKRDIEKYARYFVGDVVSGGKGLALDELSEKMTFVLPKVYSRIMEILDEVDYQSCALRYAGVRLIETDEIKEDRDFDLSDEDNIELRSENEDQEESISAFFEQPATQDLTELVAKYVSKIVSESDRDSNCLGEQIIYLLSRMMLSHQSLSTAINQESERLINEQYYENFIYIVQSNVTENIPLNLNHYNAVLKNVHELPHGKGYVGDVDSIEGFNGNLVQIGTSTAQHIFPSRGCVYIPQNILNKPMQGMHYLPVVVVKDGVGGVNDFKAESHWDDVAEVVPCQYGFDKFEGLVDELKSFLLSGGRHKVWFRLSDGSLLAPMSRKDKITTQLFFEKWQYIPFEELSLVSKSSPYVLTKTLPTPSLITMTSNSEVIRELSQFESAIDQVPKHLVSRAIYLKNISNTSVRADSFVSEFVNYFLKTEPINEHYNKYLNDYIERTSPELATLKEQNDRLSSEIIKKHSKVQALNKKYSDLEKTLLNKVEKIIKNIHEDIVEVIDDPLLMALLNSESNKKVQSSPTIDLSLSQESKSSQNITCLSENKELKEYFKELKIPVWSDEDIVKLRDDLIHFIKSGFVFQIIGPKGYVIVEMMLKVLNYDCYSHIMSIFSEGVESSIHKVASMNQVPIVISGISKNQVNMYQPALRFRYQNSSVCRCGIFIVCDDNKILCDMDNVIVFDLDMFISSKGNEYDSDDFDTDFSALPIEVDRFVSKNQGVFTDLLYLAYKKLEEIGS